MQRAPVNDLAGIIESKHLAGLSVATFAGGCFWCVEAGFEKLPGVVEAISGYSGGELVNPTYEEVSSGSTRHAEAVQVYYNPEQISYEELLSSFWRQIDPTDSGGQFVDRGKQYRPAIFYHSDEQKTEAEASAKALEEAGIYDRPLSIEIVPFSTFYPAEEYHQDYHSKNPLRYA
ncbi:MAG TPA: peptide-methionine (S)-S-oxide reductase MsrA, partial [Gammaproteobacteria bacterium]|nr:peptide-methionine (S)-S-oxide reductase MsrA [Gammaproteobacteria bacterium]